MRCEYRIFRLKRWFLSWCDGTSVRGKARTIRPGCREVEEILSMGQEIWVKVRGDLRWSGVSHSSTCAL